MSSKKDKNYDILLSELELNNKIAERIADENVGILAMLHLDDPRHDIIYRPKIRNEGRRKISGTIKCFEGRKKIREMRFDRKPILYKTMKEWKTEFDGKIQYFFTVQLDKT